MSLVAPPPNADPENASVEADGWFPAVPLAGIRDTIRLGEGVVPTPRLTAAIEGGILSALRELAEWRSARALEGAVELADVTDEELAGMNKAELLWQRAVRYYAAAELADQHRDVTATDDGLDRADEKSETADDYRRLAYAAVADLLSIGLADDEEPTPRNRVSLL